MAKFSGTIKNIKDGKGEICNSILRSLPSWFRIEQAIINYVKAVAQLPNYVARIDGKVAGFISLEMHNFHTTEISVMAIREEFHRQEGSIELMQSSDIQVVQASPDQQPVISQLMELYIYDFTEIWSFDIKDNGRYDYERLPLYWKEPNRYPYLIWIDKKLAGFVLIQKGSPIEEDPTVWDVAEFFIMRKFRKQGVGRIVAHSVWTKFPGRWQVRVLEENRRAKMFWENAIFKFTNEILSSKRKEIKGDSWLIYQFRSPI